MTSPIILLIRPQMGENIGAVARAMANFGLSELRIVAPRDGWPNPQAEAMAANALPIIQSAKLFEDVASAFADITHAYATTARPRELTKRVLTPAEAMGEILQNPSSLTPPPNLPPQGGEEKAALVFGPERTGLENDDLALCNTLITIPTSEHASLNLAQSVVILGYEWFTCLSRAQPRDHGQTAKDPSTRANALAQDDRIVPAPLAQYENLFSRLEQYLDDTDFFKVVEKKPAMMANIKTMLLRGNFTEQEIRTLHGILKALAK